MGLGLGRAALFLFLFGATIGSLLDAIHTHSGTTVYATEIAFKAAWWTPVLFGAAGLAMGLSYVLVEHLFKRSVAPDPTWKSVGLGFLGFATLYVISGFLPAPNIVKLGVLFVGAIALGALSSRTPHAFALAGFAALAGPSVEVFLVHHGAFRHLQADYFGIPIWLPALYASGSFTMGVIGKKIVSTNTNAADANTTSPNEIRPLSSDARSLP